MGIEFRSGECTDTIAIGSLNYGTIVSYGNSRYIKIDKYNCGNGLSLKHSARHSVLCNLKTGTLREIKGSFKVQVLKVCATEEQESFPFTLYLKGC